MTATEDEALSKLDRQIKALCEQRGFTFRPWEFPRPWDPVLDGPRPEYEGADWWLKAQQLRRKLIAELKGQTARARVRRSG
jgi:hypothetical protein